MPNIRTSPTCNSRYRRFSEQVRIWFVGAYGEMVVLGMAAQPTHEHIPPGGLALEQKLLAV